MFLRDLLSDCIFFFSSRRRHTRLQGDWSSDVCSSDLPSGNDGFRDRLAFFWRERLLLPTVAAVLMAVLPAIYSFHTFPFADYCNFGWSYHEYAGPKTVYRLGYRDPDDNRLKPLPVNHGGVFCLSLVTNVGGQIKGSPEG